MVYQPTSFIAPHVWKINRDSDQFEGLTHWWPMHGMGIDPIDMGSRNLVGPKILVRRGVFYSNTPPFGIVANFSSDDITDFAVEDPVITSDPFSVCAWFNMPDLAPGDEGALMTANVTDSLSDFWILRIDDGTAGQVQFNFRTGNGATSAALTSTNAVINQWQHACGVAVTSTDRRAFLNGGGKGTATAAQNPYSALERFTIGRTRTSSDSDEFGGQIVDGRLYSRALTDAQVAELSDPVKRWDLYDFRRRVVVGFVPSVGAQTIAVGTIALASSIVAPTINQTINVGAIALASSVPALAQVSQTIPVGTIPLVSSVPALQQINQTIPIEVIPLVSSIPALQQINQTIPIGTVVLASSIVAPAMRFDQFVTVGTIALASSIVALQQVNQTINVSAVALASSIPALAQISQTIPIGTIVLVSSIPALAQISQTIPIGNIVLTSAIVVPTISTSGDQTIAVGVIALASSIQALAQIRQTIPISPIALASSIVAPQLNQTINVSPVVLASSIQALTQISRTIPVSPIVLASSIQALTQINQTIPIGAIILASSIVAPTVTGNVVFVCTAGVWSAVVLFDPCDDFRVTIDGPAADNLKISATLEFEDQ